MRACEIRRLCALILSVIVAALLSASPAAARKPTPPPPEITAFDMEPVDKLAAGSELFFRVEGTPSSRVTVRVGGVARTLVLQEVDDGQYEGSYVLRASDRASAGSTATARLRRSGRTVSATMPRLALAAAAPPVAAAQPARPAAPAPVIARFRATPIDKIEPGAELKFSLEGTPGARVSLAIENVATGLPMRESSPGHYEGSYTIRRLDRLYAGMPIVATLEANGQAVRSNLGRGSMLVDAQPPTIRNLHPKEGEVVVPSGPVSVSGTFDDRGGLGVDPSSVKIIVAGRDVTPSATITKDFFTYRSELAPGRYAADVSAKDGAGNAVRSAWSFVVEQPSPGAIGLPLEITSHQPNATVAAGRLQVRGRTAPNATVDVKVTGHAAVAGFFGVTQELFSDRVTADRSGNFGFDFQPQVQIPGMRYEVELKASQGGLSKDTKLVLFQQQR